MRAGGFRLALLGLTLLGGGCTKMKPLPPGQALTQSERHDAILHAHVWTKTNVAAVNFKEGPKVEGAFARNQLVTCEYKEKKMSGMSRKFTCVTPDGDELKVKYGARNAEVYGEVLATRLFWALGFPADYMFPVRVRCKGCSQDPHEDMKAVKGATVTFDPAAIERKLPGRAMELYEDSGWKWSEIEMIAPDAAPEERAQRDALRLLAAFLQHTDSKPANQRLMCPKGEEVGAHGCKAPLMMVQDLGLTFGESNFFNKSKNSVNFNDWAKTDVWKDEATCVAKINGSFTGHFKNPQISEAGRAFLADLLSQLSDRQLHDMFEVARIDRRPAEPRSDPDKEESPVPIDEWVKLFKEKRAKIVDHHCPA